jgi:hypothetical protein
MTYHRLANLYVTGYYHREYWLATEYGLSNCSYIMTIYFTAISSSATAAWNLIRHCSTFFDVPIGRKGAHGSGNR